jgi:hypothetical protein
MSAPPLPFQGISTANRAAFVTCYTIESAKGKIAAPSKEAQ